MPASARPAGCRAPCARLRLSSAATGFRAATPAPSRRAGPRRGTRRNASDKGFAKSKPPGRAGGRKATPSSRGDLLVVEVAGGILGPRIAAHLHRAHAGVAAADVEVGAAAAAALDRARPLRL